VLRAWERRHRAVEPLRTPGGTRRYRESDVARLRLLRAAVKAGEPIGQAVKLTDAELARRADAAATPETAPDPILDAVEQMDLPAAEGLLARQVSVLGPRRFAVSIAVPLLRAVGARWERGTLRVASEHLVSALIRSALGPALRPTPRWLTAPPIVFATLPGERHELGALLAAVVANEAGGNPIYLGPDLPIEEIADAVGRSGARAVAVGVSAGGAGAAREALLALRRALAADVEVWVGGAGSAEIPLPPGVVHVADLEQLERRVALLALRDPRRPA
jgi:DNA-binding transcriptional MerR regulator